MPAHMVVVGMARKDDLDVGNLETQLFDARSNQRYALLEARVHENVSRGRDEQERRHAARTHVVQVVGQREWLEGLGPGGIVLRGYGTRQGERAPHHDCATATCMHGITGLVNRVWPTACEL